MDAKAFTDFPMLSRQSQLYDKEFEDAVRNEVARRVKRGRSQEDTDLLYDAAATVKATSPKWAFDVHKKVLEEQRKFNNQEGHFSGPSKTRVLTGKPNEHQIELARKVGLSTARLEKHIKEKWAN
jgi:hypothetical protein